jgi:hypothetical protein
LGCGREPARLCVTDQRLLAGRRSRKARPLASTFGLEVPGSPRRDPSRDPLKADRRTFPPVARPVRTSARGEPGTTRAKGGACGIARHRWQHDGRCFRSFWPWWCLAIFIDEIERFLYGAVADDEAQVTPAAAPSLGQGRRARAGFFTATQAFGSSLNLHVHWHVLATDDLYEHQPDGTLRFLRASAATHEELASVVQRVAARVRALIGEPDNEAEPIVQAPVLKVFGAEPRDDEQPSRAVQHDGFNLYANVAFEAHERSERAVEWLLYHAEPRLDEPRAPRCVYG